MTKCELQSGAKINISDGSCPERIVTVTGNTESIFKAFTLICNKFEEVIIEDYDIGGEGRPGLSDDDDDDIGGDDDDMQHV